MTAQYEFDASLLDANDDAALLSQRDAGGQIPINFVTHPSVSLREACFGHDVFEQGSAATCLSDLLTAAYRRFLVDLYWDVEQRKWTLCPVAIPASAHTRSLERSIDNVASGTAPSTVVEASETSQQRDGGKFRATRGVGSSRSSVYQVGRYSCDVGLDLSTLFDVVNGYFQDMASPLQVYTTYLIFNLHAASNASQTDQPGSAVAGSQLPTGPDQLGFMLDDALGPYIYTPAMLATERANLNESWFKVANEGKPITEYFTLEQDKNGIVSTPDGWPCEQYVLLVRERRILVGFGSIDPQMREYNQTADNGQIFPPNYLTSDVEISASANGTLLPGCFYHPEVTDVSHANASWAQSSDISASANSHAADTLRSLSALVQDLTACGISPTVNNTLLNSTAIENVDAYRNVSLSSMWSWAPDEPQGASSSSSPSTNRCAVMDLSVSGHWRAVDCHGPRLGACRISNSPFSWTVTTQQTPYSHASEACPPNSSLSLPRTGLENTYLYKYLLSHAGDLNVDPTSPNPAQREIWLDFNSLNTQSCWVTGGPGASCPYVANPQQLQHRSVLVAAIAGIVICIIAALTLFVKCNANRRNPRRRRRVVEGWDYEGVPS